MPSASPQKQSAIDIFPLAHDLRQPLRAITTTCQRLKRQGDLPPTIVTELDLILEAAGRQEELLTAVVEYDTAGSMADPDDSMPVFLVVQTACLKLEAFRARHNGTIRMPASKIQSAVPELAAKALEKILHNALKFHAPETPPEVVVETSEDGGNVQIRVTDRGIGIEPEYRRKVLEPFTRLNPAGKYPGSGLGLAICGRLLASIGGSLGIETPPGGAGTSIVVNVPRSATS